MVDGVSSEVIAAVLTAAWDGTAWTVRALLSTALIVSLLWMIGAPRRQDRVRREPKGPAVPSSDDTGEGAR